MCDRCKAAHNTWQYSYRKRVYLNRGPMLIDPTGTKRRIQALARNGWPYGYLAAQLGNGTANSIGNILRSPKVNRRTAERVAKLYDRLSMELGPSGITASRALARGWASWADWDNIDDPREVPYSYSVEFALEQRIAEVHEEAKYLYARAKDNARRKRNRPSRARINRQNYERRRARQEAA